MYDILIYTTTALFFGYGIYYLNNLNVISQFRKTYNDKISKFNQINEIMSKQVKNKNKSKYKIVKESILVIIKIVKVSIIQKFYKTVSNINSIDKNTYVIQYVIAGKLYKTVIRPYKGPCPILQISNENDDDVTDIVLPYSGSCYDFQSLKPSFFLYEQLIFQLSNGDEITFEKDEIIKLNIEK